MFAWAMPQNSAHCPRYVPGAFALTRIVFVCPGMTSVLPASCGTQNEWMTSGDVRRISTVLPAGMWISFAVVNC